MMKLKHPSNALRRIKHPKRLIILIAAGLVLAGLITYGIFSYRTWQDLDQHSKDVAAQLKTSIDTTLGTEKPTGTTTDNIDKIVKDFTTKYGTNPCQTSSLYSWQTILPAFKDIQNTCSQRSASALAVITALKPLSVFIKDEKSLADVVKASMTATATPTDYTAAAKSWQTIATWQKTAGDDAFTPVQDKTKEAATAIETAYTALATANTNEDKAAFDNATNDLKTAYALLPGLADSAKTQKATLVSAIMSAYAKL